MALWQKTFCHRRSVWGNGAKADREQGGGTHHFLKNPGMHGTFRFPDTWTVKVLITGSGTMA